MSKEYKYPKRWFKNNFVAVPMDGPGNCSACVFRGTMYCENMSCTYLDEETDCTGSVYWMTRKTYAHIGMFTEFRDWFNAVTPPRVLEISNAVMEETVRAKLEKTR